MYKLLGFSLALVLIISANLILRNHSQTSAALKNSEIMETVQMASGKSNTHSDVIEVNGILFETLMPEKTIRLPKRDEETPIQFGVRITNQTSTPYRFETQRFKLEILDSRGSTKYMSFGRNTTRFPTELDIPLIMPEASLEFWMNGKFSWYSKDCIQLSGDAGYGGIWSFYDFQPGKYQIRLAYWDKWAKKKIFFFDGESEFKDFWIGEVTTPWAQLRLR